MEPALLRVDEAATYLAIGRTTLYELIGRGELPTVHIGRSVRVPTAAIKQWIQGRSGSSATSLGAASS